MAAFATVTFPSICAEEAKNRKVTNLKGSVQLPKKVNEAIHMDGLTLSKAVATLKGRYNSPRLPYPDNWSKMTPNERRVWLKEFKKSDAYKEHEKKVAAAQAARFSVSCPIAADGSFLFKSLKPDWYELTVAIMHDKAEGESDYSLARAHILKQFFIKKTDKDHDLGTMTFKLKNVLMPGDIAPDFTITNYDGEEFKLSDYRGKYVLLDFWATWCAPCIAEIPNLVEAHKTYGGDRLKVIGLSVDEKIDQPRAFLKKRKLEYTQGYLPPSNYSYVSEAYGIRSIPSIWLIGPEGKIIARSLHGDLLKEAVKKALGLASQK